MENCNTCNLIVSNYNRKYLLRLYGEKDVDTLHVCFRNILRVLYDSKYIVKPLSCIIFY